METQFQSRLLKKELLTEHIYKFTFSAPEDFSFTAGQFVNIFFDDTQFRSYSIFNAPDEKGIIETVVKLVDLGYGSEHLGRAQIGDAFTVKGPIGNFIYDEHSPNNTHVFICAGTGLTPIHSMIRQYLSELRKPWKTFYLFYGARTVNELVYHVEFKQLAETYANFNYIPTVSREEWDGAQGYVQEHFPVLNGFDAKSFYVCGIKELIVDVVKLLRDNGVDNKDIHLERYT